MPKRLWCAFEFNSLKKTSTKYYLEEYFGINVHMKDKDFLIQVMNVQLYSPMLPQPGGKVGKKIILKIKNQNFKEIIVSKFFLHGEKDNFEEYSLILEFAKLNFPILNNYLAVMCRPYPRAIVLSIFYNRI